MAIEFYDFFCVYGATAAVSFLSLLSVGETRDAAEA